MKEINIGAAQFENKNGDKKYNLERIRSLTEAAVSKGADIVSFHEGSITGYTYIRHLDRKQLLDMAENVPGGQSVEKLTDISSEFGVPVLAGLIEKDEKNNLYNYLYMR